LRNLLVFQISRGDTRLLEVSESEAATLNEQSSIVTSDGLTRVMEVLTQTETGLRDAASKKIFIEVALIKAIEARNAVSIDSVLKRLNELRGDPSGPFVSVPSSANVATAPPSLKPAAPRAAQTSVAAPAVASASAAPVSDVDLASLWPRLLDAIGRASPFARSYFIEAHPVSFVRNVFTIGFDPEFADHIGMVDNAKNHALIATKLAELGHPGAQVKMVKDERPDNFVAQTPAMPEEAAPVVSTTGTAPKTAAAPARPASAPAPAAKPVQLNPADFKNDPLIKKALEVFKGTIVEVRA
jgi:DNA polymerase-3 subunit gamma/tau